MDQESLARGDQLLAPVGVERDQVFSVVLSRERFGNLATAKAWASNHGIQVRHAIPSAKAFVLVTRDQGDFVSGSFKIHNVGRGIELSAGSLLDPPVAAPVPATDVEKVLADLIDAPLPEALNPSPSVNFAKRGEVFVRKAEGEADPDKEVRMFGIVMKPEVPDSEGDVTSAEEISRANDQFMREFGSMGMMHQFDVSDKVKIIQNVIAPIDFEFPIPGGETKTIKAGTWYQELFSDDAEIVSRVRKGALTGLSIGGTASRVPVDAPEGEANKVAKRLVQKAEGDPAVARFVNLVVQEVSVVDAAANEEVFFVIKRKGTNSMTTPTAPAAPAADPQVVEAPITPEAPVVSEEVAKAAPEAAPAPAEAPAPVVTPEPAPAAVDPMAVVGAEVAKLASLMTDLGNQVQATNARVEELSKQITGTVAEVTKRVEEVQTVRNIAKGAGEVVVEEPVAPEANIWKGSALAKGLRRSR